MYTLGIDPGLHGGLALLDPAGIIQRLWRTPTTARGGGSLRIDWEAMLLKFREIDAWAAHVKIGGCEVAIEQMRPFTIKVTKIGRDGKPRTEAQVMPAVTVMLENSGRYKLLLEQAGLAYTCYDSVSWKAHYGLRGKGKKKGAFGKHPAQAKLDANEENKELALQLARGLWPAAPDRFKDAWDDGPVEAVLIGAYHQHLRGHGRTNQADAGASGVRPVPTLEGQSTGEPEAKGSAGSVSDSRNPGGKAGAGGPADSAPAVQG